MGTDAEACIFDGKTYRAKVVTALQRFVETGEQAAWLETLVRCATDLDLEEASCRIRGLGVSFPTVCGYLDSDFAFRDVANALTFDWEDRVCRSEACSARAVCPLHQDQSAAEVFHRLFEACVVDQCLGHRQFMGRSATPLWYADTLRAMGVRSDDVLVQLLCRLAYRGYVVGLGFGQPGGGIHGWLTASETIELHSRLDVLDLPHFEPTFPTMDAILRQLTLQQVQGKDRVRFERLQHMLFPEDRAPSMQGWSFNQISLAFLRTVSSLAVQESKGILWGNDLPLRIGTRSG